MSTPLTEEAIDTAVTERLARRPWPVTRIKTDVEVSFEFFPTSTHAGADNLSDCARALDQLAPSFFSVTYGAGGSTKDRTNDTVANVRASTSSDVAAHLTCIAATKDETHGVLDSYRESGIHRIVALRGDPPDGADQTASGYVDAAELVEGIRGRTDGSIFDISVAAYPETHPKAVSRAKDIDNLKRKLDAGADRAITQFFFNTDEYFRFTDDCRSAGISAPIIPGIMPITNFERVSGFASRCGTTIPPWMPELFGGLDKAPEIHSLIAATVAAEQCRQLSEHGVRQFHFYTMNKPELSLAVCRTLGLRPATVSVQATAAS